MTREPDPAESVRHRSNLSPTNAGGSGRGSRRAMCKSSSLRERRRGPEAGSRVPRRSRSLRPRWRKRPPRVLVVGPQLPAGVEVAAELKQLGESGVALPSGVYAFSAVSNGSRSRNKRTGHCRATYAPCNELPDSIFLPVAKLRSKWPAAALNSPVLRGALAENIRRSCLRV